MLSAKELLKLTDESGALPVRNFLAFHDERNLIL
jgi:hypothetical protein